MKFVAFAFVVVASSSVGQAAEILPRLIRSVEENERLYENLQLEMTIDTELANNVKKLANDAKVSNPKLDQFQTHIKNQSLISITLQGRQFHRHQKNTSLTRLEHGTSEIIDVFDGNTHRHFWKHAAIKVKTGEQAYSDSGGQISDQPPVLRNMARPHMFLLESGCPQIPLSIYLGGQESVLKYPYPTDSEKSLVTKVRYLGVEVFQGFRCHKVLIDTVLDNGTPHNGWELWLTQNRNLIPVRNLGYTYRWSKTIPVADTIVDEWKEIRRGVWIPQKWHTDRYDSFTVKRKGKQKLTWRRSYQIKSVSLEPKTALATFTKLDFPLETKVNVIKNGIKTIGK